MSLDLVERVEQVTLQLQEKLPVRDVAVLFSSPERYQNFVVEVGGADKVGGGDRYAFVTVSVRGQKGNPESPIEVTISSISDVPRPEYDRDLIVEEIGRGALDFLKARVGQIRASLPTEMRTRPLHLTVYNGSTDNILATETLR